MEASHADQAIGDGSSSMQDMELAQDHLNADAPATQKMTPQDEQADRESDIKPTSSPDRTLFTPDDNSQRERSQGLQEATAESMSSNDQQHEQALTRHYINGSAGLQMAMDMSSESCSGITDIVLQSSSVGKNYMKEESKGGDLTSVTEKLPPLEKDGNVMTQPCELSSTEIVLSSAANPLQLSKNSTPLGLPATALAPSFEPTAAICDGSLSTSQIEISAEVATIVSDHNCDSQWQPNDAGKPHLSGVFSDSQSNSLEDFGHGKELTLDELVQGSNQSRDDQKAAATLQELLQANKTTHPDESLSAIREGHEVEFDAMEPVGGPVQGGLKVTEPEFELDSSPIESSLSDTSSDQSSSDDLDDDDDYEMLDPAEQAARLMREDGGSDDEGMGRGNNGAGAGPPRTLNEKPDEVVPKPNLIITENMKIEELGLVENLVENLVLIKAKTSGEYQVLEFGSVLCLENRIVIGVVAETLGRVEQPYYAVRFTNERAITEVGISRGTKIFYVEQHSTSVFTQSLKNFKGSDASNLHDEEVGDEGIEFSDDEAEAEYKRKLKLTKQAKRDTREDSKDGYPRGGRQRGSKIQKRPGEKHQPGQNGTSYIDYDNPEGGDELYTPLARPSNLHEIMGRGEAPLEDQNLHHRTDRGGRGGRGRGDRGRGRGDRGRGIRGHGGHQGNFNNNTTMASERKTRAQAPGGGVGQHLGGTDFHSPPPSNDFLPPRPDPADATFPYYAAAGQNQIGHPTPAIHRLGLHRAMPQSPFDQSNNAYSQPYPTPSFYPPSSQTSYNPSQSHPPQYQYQTQPQPSQHFPPTPHHQTPMPYPQYQPHAPSPSTPNVPAGTFLNPAFFPPSAQPTSPTWPQVNPTHQLPALPNPGTSNMSPESERAFHAINVLRNLSSGHGSHPT